MKDIKEMERVAEIGFTQRTLMSLKFEDCMCAQKLKAILKIDNENDICFDCALEVLSNMIIETYELPIQSFDCAVMYRDIREDGDYYISQFRYRVPLTIWHKFNTHEFFDKVINANFQVPCNCGGK